MAIGRRQFAVRAAACLAARATLRTAGYVAAARLGTTGEGAERMYGLIGKMTAAPGQRSALVAILLESTARMPGCLSYIVAEDVNDADALWITEVWDSQESHAGSLTLPEVRAAIAKARPLISGFADGVKTAPVGGHGLVRTDA